jgi:hypothetical protein
MKKLSFLLIILSLTIIFNACPPLLEDYVGSGSDGEVVTYDGFLDCYKWFEILDKIAKDGKFVSLDLSKCTFDYEKGNTSGGLIKANPGDPVTFDPFPASSSGKNFIVSIILPSVTQKINSALEDDAILNDDESVKNAKKFSAFRSFTNLRSVKAENVTMIGNFAFADCTALNEVVFPKVGHTAEADELKGDIDYDIDIGKYAFIGCKSLKEVKFNSAAVIGGYAFKDCTSLSKIDFPIVWRIEENAFEGCKSLENIFFEEASKIGEAAFKNCTGLKKAEFNIKQKRISTGDLFVGYDPVVYDSVIFFPSAFNGCKALEVLNVRRAWNVYFSKDVLANTGSVIEIYLFDEQLIPDPDSPDPDPPLIRPFGCEGHPQEEMFLGDTALSITLKEIKIHIPIPVNDGKVYSVIAENIRELYRGKEIDVNVNPRIP